MGKWSQYRLRGTVADAQEQTETTLLERALTGGTFDVQIGVNAGSMFAAAKPVILLPVGWRVSRIELNLKKVGSPAANLVAVVYRQSVGQPALPRWLTSNVVSASTLAASYGWINFPLAAPVDIAFPNSVFVGLVTTGNDAANYVAWQSGGTAGGGVVYYGSSDPPTGTFGTQQWPWLRVFGTTI